jgi:PTS system nitrogen regulatory IIA component
MSISEVLSKDSIALHLAGRTKEEVIDELLEAGLRSGRFQDLEAARKAVLERESRMSTGLMGGVAIPHGKTNAVKSLVAIVGIADRGVDFGALDDRECRIIILTLSPADRMGPHLRFLADIGLLLEDEGKREALLSAREPDEVLQVLAAA